MNTLNQLDIDHHLHPQTNLRQHEEIGPLIIESGDGPYVVDTEGNRYFEGMSGLWCASLGFSEKRLADAAHRQMLKLPYQQTFAHRSSRPVIELAARLLERAPVPMSKVMFQSSGSEAIDTAIKLVWYYQAAAGRPGKRKIIGRRRGYHGTTVAAASLTGLPNMQTGWGLPLPEMLHVTCPHFYREGHAGETEAAFSARLVAELEQLILTEGAQNIGAFFAEPVMGTGGVVVPPQGYFEGVQAVLRKHDILFVVDEVITGFGRTGNMFGCETFDLKPDILTLAKALSASFLPISATVINDKVHDALLAESRKIGVFAHGHTYAGHPVPAAVALEALKIYEERDIVGHVRAVAPHFQARLKALGDHPLVGEARGMGLIGALEIVGDKAARTPFDAAAAIPAAIAAGALERGVILRVIRDAIAICPPLIIEQDEVDTLFDALAASLDATLEHARSEGLLTAA